jgi:hypothetical protein
MVILALITSPLVAEEPDFTGTWAWSAMTVTADGKSEKVELDFLGGKLDARFEVTRSRAGYQVVPIRVDGKASEKFELKITRSGKNFISEYTNETTRMTGLLQVEAAEVRVIFDPKNLALAPANFEVPSDDTATRIELTFKRVRNARAESIVWVKGPRGATVSIGDWSDTLKDAPLGIRTELLPTDRETPFDVVLQISSDGKMTKDRIRVWAIGGTEPTADFSDIKAPDAAIRTFKYWESCTKTLHRHLKDAERAENNAQRKKSLSELTGELRTTPSRGVDINVVNKWLALVAASDRLQANQRQVENGELAAEALLRGLSGDPFGTARDVVQRDKVDMDAFGKSFLELKNLAPVLSAKYETDFPIP